MARVAGVEPAAYRLGGDRSIQLSYTRTNAGLFIHHNLSRPIADEP